MCGLWHHQAIKSMKMVCTPFPVIVQPWESISLDYLTRYPITEKQNDTILVMVDRFPKRVFLIPCKNTRTTQYFVHFFFKHVWKHYSLLIKIISNKDSRFVNTFYKRLWHQLNTLLSILIMFHAQPIEIQKL